MITIITIYELLGMIKDEPDRSIYIKYFDKVNKKEAQMWACKENIIYKLDQLIIELNDTVEIIEEPKKIEKIARCDDIKMTHYGELHKPTENEEILRIKVNELIDEINNLKEND